MRISRQELQEIRELPDAREVDHLRELDLSNKVRPHPLSSVISTALCGSSFQRRVTRWKDRVAWWLVWNCLRSECAGPLSLFDAVRVGGRVPVKAGGARGPEPIFQ